MKLLGVTNNKVALASVAHYDYRSYGEGDEYIMQDGGTLGTPDYAGYNRKWGKSQWFEVPQTMAELYNDYNCGHPRKYGIWPIEEVKILSPEEFPDVESFEWRAENAIWGTNGPNGDQPTTYVLIKDCEADHLQKISELLQKRFERLGHKTIQETKKIVDHWLNHKTKHAT